MDTFAGRYIGVGVTVQQQERGVDFIGGVEWALGGVEIGAVPGETLRGGAGTIGVSPIPFAPVGGNGTDAGVRYGRGKEGGTGLEVLGHEASIRGADTPYFSAVDPGVFPEKAAGALNDVVGGFFAPGIDMSSRELLSESDGAAGLNVIDHIAHGGVEMERVAALKTPVDRCGAPVVVYNEGIFLAAVEPGWQIVAAVNGGAVGRGKVEGFDLAQRQLPVALLLRIGEQCRTFALQIHGIDPPGFRNTLPHVDGHRSMGGHLEGGGHINLQRKLREAAALQVVAIDSHIIAVGYPEVNGIRIGRIPFHRLNRRIELPRQRGHFSALQIHEIGLIVVEVRDLLFRKGFPRSVEGVGGAQQQKALSVGREAGRSDESLLFEQGVAQQGG